MTEKELKKLSRTDLLKMLIMQSEEVQTLRERLELSENLLKQREIGLSKAGSIAEASLALNGVFEAAQAACEQYMENIRLHSERQEEICRQIETEHRIKLQRELEDSRRKCEIMEAETRRKCDQMLQDARWEAQAYWTEVSQKLDAYYAQHAGLKELLLRAFSKEQQEGKV